MSRKLIQENMEKIKQIIQSSYPYSYKEKELIHIPANFIENYCNEKKGFIKLAKSGVVRTYSSLKYILTKNELVGFACNNLVFHRDEEFPTILELIDKCIFKKIINENEYWKQYSREDLQELIDRSNNGRTRFVTGKSLFLDSSYLYKCSICDSNLRNLCICKQLLSKDEFGKRPRKSEYYEKNILNYIPIVKDMQTDMKIWAIYNYGYENNTNYSYFDCLGIKIFPLI